MKSILLLGEQNSHGNDPLHPLLANASGGRLAKILGLSTTDYLRQHDRVNLCLGAWDEAEARESARSIFLARPKGSGVMLLGRRVERAVGWFYPRFEVRLVAAGAGLYMLALPHPSGLCHIWNDSENVTLARRAYTELRSLTEAAA